MSTNRAHTLSRLSDTGQSVADPSQDVRGRSVRDSAGVDVGKVDELLVDAEEGKVRFLRVEHGGILGLGATPSFVPVEAISEVTDDEVRLDQTGQHVADAPRYDPELAAQDEYYDNLYGYYGYPPFWTPGYVYPPFPLRH